MFMITFVWEWEFMLISDFFSALQSDPTCWNWAKAVAKHLAGKFVKQGSGKRGGGSEIESAAGLNRSTTVLGNVKESNYLTSVIGNWFEGPVQFPTFVFLKVAARETEKKGKMAPPVQVKIK